MINSFEGYLNGLWKTDFEIVQNLDNPDFEKKYDYNKVTNNDLAICLNLYLDYEKIIDIKNFIGYPSIKYLGGHTIEDKTLYLNWGICNKELTISEYDKHPNKLGHEKIAEFIYDRLG